MNGDMSLGLKSLLTRIGRRTPLRLIHSVNATLNYLEVGRWMQSRGFVVGRRRWTREELFGDLARTISDRPVLYLEFGVYRGDSMRYWSRALRHPDTRLHGFDSFQGLPQNWNSYVTAGDFSTGGAIPVIEDPRVKFFPGWIEDTLPIYQFPDYEILVLMLDVDIYSTTAFILEALAERITVGTFLYFDDFSDRNHQLRALDEFVAKHAPRLSLFGATLALSQTVFACIA
jgi:macrocin-O-methyltransferase TylF-like protien